MKSPYKTSMPGANPGKGITATHKDRVKAETGATRSGKRLATYPLKMASRKANKEKERKAMARYMIVYVQNGNTMAQFSNSMIKLMNIQDNLFRFGVKFVQWYELNRYNEYVYLSTVITNR